MATNHHIITIDRQGGWQFYWGPGRLPAGATALGTVTGGDFDHGALLRLASGVYVQGNAGVLRSLPQDQVQRRLANAQQERGA